MSTTRRTKKSPAKKRPATKAATKKRASKDAPAPLPKALAQRAKAQHAAKLERLATRARAAIARIRERQTDIAANMVDIGLALAELKEEGMAEALGRSGFAEVCERDLRMPISTAHALVALATRVPREVVTRLGPDRARAVLELVDATPADDTPEDVLDAKLKLPSGETLEVASASVQEIRDAARAFRDAHAPKEKRSPGFTASHEEKRRFAALTKHLKDGGVGAARLVATRDGKGSKVRFEVRLTELADFAELLRKAAKG